MKTPSRYDDVIDSRDVISALDDLESERDDLLIDEDDESVSDEAREKAEYELEEWEESSGYKALKALCSEGEDYASDWRYGATLIRETYFATYAEELAHDTCGGDFNSWPLNCIDWDHAAEQLKQDYTEIEFDGVSYFVR